MKSLTFLIGVVVGYDIQYNTTEVPLTNWLSYFSDLYVADLPMVPGSHDSGAVEVSPEEDWLGVTGWLYAKTQNLSVRDQLNAGVRFLDIRLWVIYEYFDQVNTIHVSHTFKSSYTLPSLLAEVAAFLVDNPTEFVYMQVRIDAQHPLTQFIPEQKKFVEQILQSSQISWANVNGYDLLNLKVREVAGKVLLICQDGSVLLDETEMVFISYPDQYELCDIFEYSSQYLAQEAISTCFPSTPISSRLTGKLTGFALDGQFDQVWPAITSPAMNEWFIYNFQSNPDWQPRTLYPIGIFLIDFVDPTQTAILVEYIMNFGYPYPYMWPKPAWELGMPITTKSAAIIAIHFLIFLII